MNALFRKSALLVMLLASTVLFSGCATQGKPPPTISLDEPVQAQPLPEPPAPVEVVAVPEVLPMPAQLKPVAEDSAKPAPMPEPADEKVRVSRANAEARGACGLQLETAKTNLAGQALYERLGYVRDELYLTYWLSLANT